MVRGLIGKATRWLGLGAVAVALVACGGGSDGGCTDVFGGIEEYDVERGVPHSLNFDTYRIPRTADMPLVEIVLVEAHEPTGPFGAKGIGEPAMIATAPAIANAIADAIGKPVTELPAKPELILSLLK